MSIVENILNRYPLRSDAILTILSLDQELVNEINSERPLTIVLPSNQALSIDLSYCSESCLQGENFTNLRRIFRYHVIPGIVNFRGGYKTLEGDVMYFNPLGYINDKFAIKEVVDFEGNRLVFTDRAFWPRSVEFCCREERRYLYERQNNVERLYGGRIS